MSAGPHNRRRAGGYPGGEIGVGNKINEIYNEREVTYEKWVRILSYYMHGI